IRCNGYIRRASERRKGYPEPRLIGFGKTYHIPFDQVTYNQDGLISQHNTGFADVPRFAEAYVAAKSVGSWAGPWGQADIHWRAHVLCWVAQHASRLPGDFVECGVNKGGTAMLVIDYLGLKNSPGRYFYLYDTFEGLDETLSSELELRQTNAIYSSCFEEVTSRFARFPNVVIVKGSIPQSLQLRAPEKVAYLHIDLNSAHPERAALEFFWKRLVPGAVVVFDDYAWVACRQQKRAIDDFALQMGCVVLTVPTGQGLLIKPI
ncbi:MAG: TylF/MycF/NovP-related O-methyltransferase, partial [Terrimicrobiaceae bacterium]